MGIQGWWGRLRSKPVTDVIKHKHRFVVMDTDTFKEKFSFQLSGINIFVTVGITVILLILVTSVVIAFTPLREWIPGYTDSRTIEQTFANARKVDSLETLVSEQEWMLNAIRAAISGEELGAEVQAVADDTSASLQQYAAAYRRSKEDSLLRQEVEREDNRYEVKSERSTPPPSRPAASPQVAATAPQAVATAPQAVVAAPVEPSSAFAHLFFTPLKGKILKPFDPASRHLGLDIAGSISQAVYAAYSGTVVSANFTAEQGYVIAIQHPGNVITVYRNNGTLLKRQGDVVRAGEPIGYVGNTGISEQGPHLHFELWSGGSPVNPEEYISF